MSARAAAACWLTAGIAYLALEVLAAQSLPGYRYANDVISDLGRPSSPGHVLMNIAFAVQGALFLAAATLLITARHRRLWPFVAFAACNALGNLVVAAVPSGPSGIAWLHAAGAVLAIVGGNAAILTGWSLVSAAGWYRAVSIGAGLLGLLSFVVFAVVSIGSVSVVVPAAVWERTSVYTIIGWQLLSAIQLLRVTERTSSN